MATFIFYAQNSLLSGFQTKCLVSLVIDMFAIAALGWREGIVKREVGLKKRILLRFLRYRMEREYPIDICRDSNT